MSEIKRVFMVDGQPFFPLGGQARNSSGYSMEEAEAAFKAVDAMHGNMVEIPVYWDQIEPEEGQFDFGSIYDLLSSALLYEVKLALLWFGAWKNGAMEYTPRWVKTNPQRFRRVQTPLGGDTWVLSSHCQANWEADCRAYTALCRFLKEKDSERKVIAIQIENEPGILGSDRDYGAEGQADFERPVPSDLLAKMRAARQGRVHDLWQAAGGAESGSWAQVFGRDGGELMTAYSIATYIDRLAEAGKAILDVPMYVNVWLGEGGWRIPGETYPSGGAVAKVLDIYRWCAPHIDLIAPDIYVADSRGYEAMCAAYSRVDNPLFIPESAPGGANAWNMFRAIADYHAIGYAFFAAEQVLAEDGSVRPEARMLVESFQSVAAALPLILQYQGTGRMHAIVQEENQAAQTLDLEGYIGVAQFGAGAAQGGKDWRHHIKPPVAENTRARGLVIQASRHEFYLIGANYRLSLRQLLPAERMSDMPLSKELLQARLGHYVSVEEGHFEAGAFLVDRVRNGDETDHGLWVEPDSGVVRAILCE